MQEAMVPWSSSRHSLRTGGCHRGKATVLPISTEGGERRCRLERSCLVQESSCSKAGGGQPVINSTRGLPWTRCRKLQRRPGMFGGQRSPGVGRDRKSGVEGKRV